MAFLIITEGNTAKPLDVYWLRGIAFAYDQHFDVLLLIISEGNTTKPLDVYWLSGIAFAYDQIGDILSRRVPL